MISPKDSHFLDHFSPQEDDELPPLESVEPEPALGGGTFLMGIYDNIWVWYGNAMDNSPFVGYFCLGYRLECVFFLNNLFGIWKRNPSTDIYHIFPACVWSIFSWQSFNETSTMIRLANPRSYTGFHCWSKPQTIRKC